MCNHRFQLWNASRCIPKLLHDQNQPFSFFQMNFQSVVKCFFFGASAHISLFFLLKTGEFLKRAHRILVRVGVRVTQILSAVTSTNVRWCINHHQRNTYLGKECSTRNLLRSCDDPGRSCRLSQIARECNKITDVRFWSWWEGTPLMYALSAREAACVFHHWASIAGDYTRSTQQFGLV